MRTSKHLRVYINTWKLKVSPASETILAIYGNREIGKLLNKSEQIAFARGSDIIRAKDVKKAGGLEE